MEATSKSSRLAMYIPATSAVLVLVQMFDSSVGPAASAPGVTVVIVFFDPRKAMRPESPLNLSS